MLPGDCYGEVPVMTRTPYLHHFIADEGALVAILDSSDFRRYIAKFFRGSSVHKESVFEQIPACRAVGTDNLTIMAALATEKVKYFNLETNSGWNLLTPRFS